MNTTGHFYSWPFLTLYLRFMFFFFLFPAGDECGVRHTDCSRDGEDRAQAVGGGRAVGMQ